MELGIGGAEVRIEPPDAVRAEIAFKADGDGLVDMRLAVGGTAEQPGFLRAREQHPDRAQRLARACHVLRCCRDDRAARAVVDRARPLPPAVEVAGEQHRRERRIAPRDLAHHVAALGLTEKAGRQHQLHGDRLALGTREHAFEVRRIGVAQRARRGRGDAFGKIGAAGVGIAMIVGTDRLDDRCHRALLRRDPGCDPARGAGKAVLAAILGAGHGIADKGDLALEAAFGCGLQFGDVPEHHDLCGDPSGPGRGRVTQRCHREALREGADDLGLARLARNPRGHHVGFVSDIREPLRLEPCHRPRAPAGLGFRARLPLADLGGDPLDKIPGNRVALQGCVGRLCQRRRRCDGFSVSGNGERKRGKRDEGLVHGRRCYRAGAPKSSRLP